MLKFAYTVATPDVGSKSLKAYCGPLDTSLAVLAGLGYGGAELMVRSPRDTDTAAIERAVQQHGLVVPVVGTGQLVSEDGLSLTHATTEGRQAAIQRLREVIDFAAVFGAQVNLGRVRGPLPPDQAPDAARALVKDGLLRLLEYAERRQVRLILEPQNKSIINWLNTVSETLAFIGQVGQANLGTMVDTYHSNIEERSIVGALARAGQKLWYVHVADSNGCAPGQGHLNFPEILDVIEALPYDGFVTVEVTQLPSHQEAARQSMEYLAALGYAERRRAG